MSRILGVDYGERKVGLAISDPFGWTAQGLQVIRFKGEDSVVIDTILQLVKEYTIKTIVVGLPKHMNNSVGERGRVSIGFAEKLKKEVDPTEVLLWDERLTTKMAKMTMSDMGLSIREKKKSEDKIAAVFLLQSFLDAKSIKDNS